MAASRTIDITQLEQTRKNLVNLCFHLLGFSKAEKAAYVDAVYKRLFNRKLSSTLENDFGKKFKSLSSTKVASQIADELTGCIIRIPNEDIRNMLEIIIKEYASKCEAAAVIYDLNQQQQKIKYADPALQKISQNEWQKTFKQLERHVSFKEKIKLIQEESLKEFLAMCIAYVSTIKFAFSVMSLNYKEGDEMTLLFRMEIAGLIAITTMLLIVFKQIQDTLLNQLLYSNKKAVKYDSARIDDALKTIVHSKINEYYIKKHDEIEKIQERLAALNAEIKASHAPHLENENSDTEADTDSEEERPPVKREKVKRRPAFPCPPPAPEIKEINKQIDTLFLDETNLTHRYERIGNFRAGLFFHFDPKKLNRLITGSSEIFDKFEAAILTRRYNQPHAKKLGVTELSLSELSQEESGSTHKVRIKGRPRLFIELRDPTPEEQENGIIKRVLSPRRYASKH